ncbi:sugar transferase, partial [Campylobacter sp. MIT 12-5580]
MQFILTHIDTIQEWLASDKFKKLYLETKHPYPALLDCDVLNENLEQGQKSVGDEDKVNKNLFVNKSLSYTDIEADIAWELNLGLP